MTKTHLSGIAEARQRSTSNSGHSLRKALKIMGSAHQDHAKEYLPSDEDVSFLQQAWLLGPPVIIPDAILAIAERGMTRFLRGGCR